MGERRRPAGVLLRDARRLRVTIDLPGFEEAMALASSQAVVTFIGHEGDSPEKFLRVLEGTLVKVEVAE